MHLIVSVVILIILLYGVPVQSACECGIPNQSHALASRSFQEEPYFFPWTAFIAVLKDGRKREKCTGALIHEFYVLTAAHCTPLDQDPKKLFVSFNQECGTKNTPTDQMLQVSQVFRHPRYAKCEGKGECTTNGGDVAVLKLKTPQPDITPICLGVSGSYDDLVVSGWGRIDDNVPNDNGCQHVAKLQIVDDASCHKFNPTSPIEFVMCAGSKETSNICSGDSGSALMTLKGYRWFEVGISSFGKDNCATTNEPSGFEKVAPHIPWIRKVTSGAVCINREPENENTLIVGSPIKCPEQKSPIESLLPHQLFLKPLMKFFDKVTGTENSLKFIVSNPSFEYTDCI